MRAKPQFIFTFQDAVEKVEYYPVDQVSDDDDDNGNDDDHAQLYEDPALYTGLECGQITFTSGDTLRGWFSGDLSSVRVGELTRWSQVSVAICSQEPWPVQDIVSARRGPGAGAVEARPPGGRGVGGQPVRGVGTPAGLREILQCPEKAPTMAFSLLKGPSRRL